MIFENNTISVRQKNRIAFWYVFGAGIVFLPMLLLKLCKESMIPCLLAGYLLFLVISVIKSRWDKRGEARREGQDKGRIGDGRMSGKSEVHHRWTKWIKRGYCLLECAGLLYALLKLILYRLVPQENSWCIAMMLGFLVIYAGWNGLECFARGAEVLFVPWLIGIFIAALTLYIHVFSDGFFTIERAESLILPFSFSWRNLAGTMLSFVVFWRTNFCYEKGEGSVRAKAFPGFMLILLMCGAVLFHGIKGMEGTAYEMLSLVYTGRWNTVLSSLWILGILYAAGYDFAIAVYGGNQKILPHKTGRTFLVKVGLAAVFALGMIATHGKKPVSIESRSYATVQCVGKTDGKKDFVPYGITYIFPYIQMQDEGEKSGKEKERFYVETDSLESAETSYQEASDRSVDFRHLQCVILENDILQDGKALGKLISDWKNEGKYERNAYVFCCEDIRDILKKEESLDHPLGQYLWDKMTKLRQMEGMDSMRLGTMMDLYYEGKLEVEKICRLDGELEFGYEG